MGKRLIIAGGIANLVFVALHLALPWMLDWGAALQSLTPDARATVYTLNLALAFVLLIFASMSLVGAATLGDTRTGRLLLIGIAGFYLLRGVCEFVFYPTPALALVAVCGVIAGLYLWPVVMDRRGAGRPHPTAHGAA